MGIFEACMFVIGVFATSIAMMFFIVAIAILTVNWKPFKRGEK